MGIKFDEATQTWSAYFSKRHPITKVPKSYSKTGLKTKVEAQRAERDLIVKMNDYFQDKVIPTWAKLLNEYYEVKSISDWNQKTLQDAQLMLNAHTEKWKSRRVDSITSIEVKRLIDERMKDRTESSKQTLLKFIRGAFQYAVEQKHIPSNPAPNIRYKIGEKLKKVLTEAQARLLLEKAKEYSSPWYYHWALALYTGMRNGELFALTWDKVNLDNRVILVDAAWNKQDGFKDTKSGNDRIVEIAPSLLVVLKELKLKNFDSHFVLPRSRDWEKGEQARHLRMFLQALGLPQVRFHDLRASWATMMLSHGVEPIKVMAMGGWQSLSRLQIYVRKSGVHIKGITDSFDLHNPCQKDAEVVVLKSL
ncbi:tyrosine-type recombinase/integrase [Bdellovibrio sp. HCB-110]|uniref:tyrosine-type recombinase/integrase n=1 Tax=Bdellovibrio sp. HCB-110 TaxID=3391182 RepID=UPI0039B49FAD